MKVICSWSDCPDGIPRPMYQMTEQKFVCRTWFKDVSLKDARALVSWWNTQPPHTYSYESNGTNYDVIRHEVVWF